MKKTFRIGQRLFRKFIENGCARVSLSIHARHLKLLCNSVGWRLGARFDRGSKGVLVVTSHRLMRFLTWRRFFCCSDPVGLDASRDCCCVPKPESTAFESFFEALNGGSHTVGADRVSGKI